MKIISLNQIIAMYILLFLNFIAISFGLSVLNDHTSVEYEKTQEAKDWSIHGFQINYYFKSQN